MHFYLYYFAFLLFDKDYLTFLEERETNPSDRPKGVTHTVCYFPCLSPLSGEKSSELPT